VSGADVRHAQRADRHIDGDDTTSPLTLNVEVYDPTNTPGLSLQIRAVGGTFDDSAGGPLTEVCIPVLPDLPDASPVFSQPIVFPPATATSVLVVFAQLYQAGDGGGSARAAAPDATIADGGTAGATGADSGAPHGCSGYAVYPGAVWPPGTFQVVDAGAGDVGVREAATRDAGASESSRPDAGAVDASRHETGAPDAGHGEAGGDQ
jgi:hypothetical protein